MRVPLLAGTRVAVVDAADTDVVLTPPPPGEAIDDVGAAVRDALRFPLAGEPLEALVTPGGRAIGPWSQTGAGWLRDTETGVLAGVRRIVT